MKIRIAKIEDVEATLTFLSRFRGEGLNTVLKHDGVPSPDTQREFIAKLDGQRGVMILAEAEECVVGSLTVERKSNPQLLHSCEFGIGILDSHRGQGVGTKMIERMIDWATSLGLVRVELSVFASNTNAIRLYEKLGFEVEGKKKGAVLVEGAPVDLVEMAKNIQDSNQASEATACSRLNLAFE